MSGRYPSTVVRVRVVLVRDPVKGHKQIPLAKKEREEIGGLLYTIF